MVDDGGTPVGLLPVGAGTGYDLVTGLGTPVANKLVPDLAKVSAATAAKPTKSPAAPAASPSGGSSGSSTRNRSKPNELPALPASGSGSTAATTDLSAVQASLTLRNSAGTPTTFAPVASPAPGINTTFAALPPGVPSAVSLASNSAGRLRIDGGGGGDPLDVSNPPTAPDAPANPAATPPAATPQAPAPKKTDPDPDAPAGVDAVFFQGESLPDLAEGQTSVGLPLPGAGLASRAEPSAAVLGLALAFVLHRHGQPALPADRERRRLRVRWRE